MMEAGLPWRLIAYSTASAVGSWPRRPWLWTGSMECKLDHVIGRATHLDNVVYFDAVHSRNVGGMACAVRSTTPNIWNMNVLQ